MLQGLELRRAILQALVDRQASDPLAPFREPELAAKLAVPMERVDAHLIVLERSGHIHFMNMPDAHGGHQRFITITETGEAHLRTAKSAAPEKSVESPFKVVAAGQERAITDFGELRSFVEKTEWVLDDEKPEILTKIGELERVVGSDRFDPAATSALKLYFERHKWLSPHVTAILKKHFGF